MDNNIMLYLGTNKYQINNEINKLCNDLNLNELGISKFDCEEISLDEVINDCETLPFLSEKKIVIISNPIFLSNEKNKLIHNIEKFIEYINNPNKTTILVINSCDIKIDKKKKIYKALQKKAKICSFDNISEQVATQIIKNKFKQLNANISYEAIYELINRTECDSLKLYSELDKISFYIDDKNNITIDDIKLLVPEPIETNIFNLTNNIIDRNIEKSLHLYKKLLIQHEEPIVFSSILSKNLHNIYIIKQYQKKKYSENQLRSILKIHPYQLKKFYRIAQKTKEEVLINNINAFSKYDINVKVGKIDKYLGLELLILDL